MLTTCDHEGGCNKLVDIDAWAAYPDEFAGVPHLCDEHIKPHEATNRERFRARRERKREGS